MKRSFAEIRLQADFQDLTDLPSNINLNFQDPDLITNFTVHIVPQTGYYTRREFIFTVKVPTDYPYSPPKVLCTDKELFHPNILDGKICLNILREEWSPAMNIKNVIYGLLLLLTEPNVDDPLNKEAAELMRLNPKEFSKRINLKN